MILSNKEKKRLVDNLTWPIADMQHKYNEVKGNLPQHGDLSQGDYSPELKELMSLLEDIKKTQTSEVTGYHRKSVAVNCREFDCPSNRQGTCALSTITLEKISDVFVGRLRCVQAVEKEEDEKGEKLEPEEENPIEDIMLGIGNATEV